MDVLYDKIAALCNQRGVSITTMCKDSGASRAAISDLKMGRSKTLSSATLTKIAAYFSISVDYLLGNEETEKPAASESDELQRLGLEPYSPKGQMPILGRVAAGLPMYADENIIGYCANDFTDGESYYALTVHGDSMNAAGIDDGDLVVVRQQPTVDDGQIAVVLVDGQEATIKYVRQQGDVIVLAPKSYNPAHQPLIYNAREVPIRVIGRVVQVRKMM